MSDQADQPADDRPRVWTGHLGPVPIPDLDAGVDFYLALGCRSVHRQENMAILELRGGTHLIVETGDAQPGEPSPFDLMVDDLDDTHEVYVDAGLEPAEITGGQIHRTFTVTDPGGRVITVYDSHVVGNV